MVEELGEEAALDPEEEGAVDWGVPAIEMPEMIISAAFSMPVAAVPGIPDHYVEEEDGN
ncbi:hypothetical protein [Rhizobium sp. CC-YZS058]|uniref:hypothetical protein n=1 Tax=Rhizobium sp. CC-YZS058 TaxID=3042153 RepID=UPI002B05BEFD|nr:hypothetical protein [Rhizobium sp. CC-YZS058]MEA3533244.1 hypothetical protein [Rhizobium sp. CC-YZS058]